jgi:hypothetical protein
MSAYGDHERKAISRLRSACLVAVGLCPIVQRFPAKGRMRVKTPLVLAGLSPRVRGRIRRRPRRRRQTEATGSDEFNQPDNGTRFVAAVFQITGVSGTATHDSNSDASLTGSNQQVYQANFNIIAGYTDFNSDDLNVTPGQSESGAVSSRRYRRR